MIIWSVAKVQEPFLVTQCVLYVQVVMCQVSGEDRPRGAAAILSPVCCAYCSELYTKLYENFYKVLNKFFNKVLYNIIKITDTHVYLCMISILFVYILDFYNVC